MPGVFGTTQIARTGLPSRPAPPPRVVVQAPTLPPIVTARAPAPTRQQVAAATYRAAPPAYTKPAYVPPPSLAPPAAQAQAKAQAHQATLAGQFRDAGPTGDYGTKAANAFKQTDAYKQSVLEVFLHQAPYQRQAIVSGALHNTASPEAKMILDYVKRTGGGPTGGANLVPAAAYGSVLRATLPAPTAFEKVLQAGAKDIVNLAPGTLQSVWSLGKQAAEAGGALATGDLSGAASHALAAGHQVVDPFVHFAGDPWGTFKADPVNTLLMFSGAKSLLGKGGGAVMRSGVLGGAAEAAASTAREPLSLGTISGQPAGAPLAEMRSYSKDIFNKPVQVAREKYIRKVLGQDPNVARPAPRLMPQSMQDAFNVGQEAKLRRVGNEMASVQQTLQRAERGRMVKEADTAKPKGKAARNVVTHILQNVARPNTAQFPTRMADDLASEAERLKSEQLKMKARSQSKEWNKQQVRDIERVLKTPGALEQAIAAAERLRPVINGQDTVLEHHAILTPEQLTAKYFPYAQKWMGATYDHTLGRLVNAQHPDGIPIEEIQRHLQGWRDVPNPEFDRATRVRQNTDQVLRTRQAAHNQSAAEYRAAVEHHRNVSAIDQGQPTPLEIQKLVILRALRDRPGTPGEGAAAQAAMDRIEAKVRERGGGADPAALRGAEDRLASANAERQRTRVDLNNARESSYRAQGDLAETPRTVNRKVGGEVPEPAFVGHYANKATPRQYYMRYVKSRGTLSQGKRTGAEFLRGGYDNTYEGLTGQMAARAQAVAKAGIHDRLVQRSYLKPKDVVANQVKQEWAKARDAMRGKSVTERTRIEAKTRKETANIRTGMYTPGEARAVIHAQPRDDYGNLMPGEIEMEPIAASSQKTIEWVRDLQNPMQLQGVSDLEAQALQRAIDEAKGRTDGVRNVVLAPKVLTDQLTEQFKPGGRVERGVGRWVQQFRNTVLPYSTHWMAQIGTEAMVRSALAGIFSPHYIADAKALYERLGKTDAGRAAAAEMTGATFYGQHGTMGIYHSPNPLLRRAQSTLGSRNIIAAHKLYTRQVGKLMYSFEENARMAGLGKLMHDHAAEIREFGKGWQGALRLQGQVIDQIAHGLETNPALVAKFGRKIDDLFGQYGKYSPRTRAIIQSIAPFLPWYLTASKYVFWQLPVHHPIASGLLASLRQTVNQDVADGKKEPLNAYATQAFGTFSPFGIFTPESTKLKAIEKELVQKGSSLFLPQVTGAYNAAVTGTDPFGSPLRGPHGVVKALSPAAIGQGVNALAEGSLPLLTKLRQVAEGGRPSYGTSSLLFPQPRPGQGPASLGRILSRTLGPSYSLQRALKAKPRVVTTGGRGGGGGGGTFGPTLSPGGGGGGFGPTLRP